MFNNVFDLYDHNISAYQKILSNLENKDIVSIIHGTGTGKSHNGLQLAYDFSKKLNNNSRVLYIVPSNGIIEHLKEIINSITNLDFNRDFSKVDFITYQSLVYLSDEEIEKMKIGLLILDEFHHIGAPIWGKKIEVLVKSHPEIKVFGMTAYTVRDRGTIYERDMIDSDSNELFSNSVVSEYDICDAMIDGVLPKPIYKTTYIDLLDKEEKLEQLLKQKDISKSEKEEYLKILKDARKKILSAPSAKQLLKNSIKKDGKYLYFCPATSETGIDDIDSIITETKNLLYEMGLSDEDFVIYKTTSEMRNNGKLNRIAFYNDKTLDGKNVDDKLRIMFAINQYNEGIHAPNVDGVILGRFTSSDIIYFEQLGRALSVRGNTKNEYSRLEKLSNEELKKLCLERNIYFNDDYLKEDLIQLLIAPVVIDLAGNIDFIKDLENNLTGKIKQIIESSSSHKRKIKISNPRFDIEVVNQDIYEILEYVTKRLAISWEDKFELLQNYNRYYGDLNVSEDFRTFNGYDYDENGTYLGRWLVKQKILYRANKLSENRKKLLESLNIDLRENSEIVWEQRYLLAKAYYEHFGNLEIKRDFKTNNGYEYDENGYILSQWIYLQRKKYSMESSDPKYIQKRKLLEDIGMDFSFDYFENLFDTKYELAKAYYEHYGNLEIPKNFITVNGVDYDEEGTKLGVWLNMLRQFNKNKKLSKERKKKLEDIGMDFNIINNTEEWMKKYELAKVYYEHYGNLEIPFRFKTINGIIYDEEGISLGAWLRLQRNGIIKQTLSNERTKLLQQIGIRIETKDLDEEWMKKYELAKAYYEYYGNLEIKHGFKTKNGYEYDADGVTLGLWISAHKQKFNGKRDRPLSIERIEKLEEIGIQWISEKTDKQLQIENIEESNYSRKKIEILNRTISFLKQLTLLGVNEISSKDDIKHINQEFIKKLTLH